MTGFDDILDRATRRLRLDPALRLEVRHELASHLQDAAGEYRDAGYSDAAADAEALRALGDADALADLLWQANRRRIRLRAAGWWVARLTLLPAVVVLVFWVILGEAAVMGGFRTLSGGYGRPTTSTFLGQLGQAQILSQMSPRERLIFFGDRNATSAAEAAKVVRDAFASEPLYQIRYVQALLNDLSRPDEPQTLNPAAVAQLRSELDRGRALNPRNGYYDLIDAYLYFRQAGAVSEDESRGLELPSRDADGIEVVHPQRLEVEDPEALAKALAALGRAASHPYVSDFTMAVLRDRLKQLPPAQSLGEWLVRASEEISTLLPHLSAERTVAKAAAGAALMQAEAGDARAAAQTLENMQRVNQKLAAGSEIGIDVMVRRSVAGLHQHAQYFVARALGDEQAAEAAREAAVAQRERFWELRGDLGGSQDELASAGLLLNTLQPALPNYQINVEPFRMAEYAAADRAALVALVGVLTLGALAGSAVGLLSRLRRRSPPKQAVLIWPGWRAAAKVLLVGVLVPVGAFVVFSLSRWGGRDVGLNAAPTAVAAYVPLAVATVAAIWFASSAALRRRAQSLGLVTPDPRSRIHWAIIVVCLVLPGAGWLLLPAVADRMASIQQVAVGVLAVLVVMTVLGVLVVVAMEAAWTQGLPPRPVRSAMLAAGVVATGVLFVVLSGQNLLTAADAGEVLAPPVLLAVVLVAVLALRDIFPAAGRWLMVVVGSALAAAVLTMAAASVWFAVEDGQGVGELARGLAVLVALALMVAALVALGRSLLSLRGGGAPAGRFAASTARSLAPLLLGAALLLLVVVEPARQAWERSQIEQITAAAPVFVAQEVERSDLRHLRAELAGAVAAPPERP